MRRLLPGRASTGVTIAAMSLGLVAAAHADVYGYVDDAGTMHLATSQLDAKYALFLKAPAANGPGGAKPVEATVGPDPSLSKSRLFRRLVDHPNIARYEPLIRAASARHGLDFNLVKAMVAVESGFEPSAVSDKGAVGLMQVLPATGERYGVRADRRLTVDAKLAEPKLNLEIGTRYLADLRRQFPGRPELALAAYNAGENAVVRFGNRVPPFPETVAYVKLVDQFQAFYTPPGKPAGPDAVGRERIRVSIPARRGLPDPNRPIALPPVVETPAPKPPVDDRDERS